MYDFISVDSTHEQYIYNICFFPAYRQMGYNLSPQFAQTVVAKFDIMGRQSLTLDNFIQSCVMLKSLTDAFKSRDPTSSGTVNMSYEDFMTLAVFNKI